MLYRLVRPMRRKGSSHVQFVQRIPRDVQASARGLRLAVPVGSETVVKTISPRAADIRLSLRTRDPSEAKVRQATVAAYLENVWRSLRQEEPTRLTHKQATALAGELYRAWAGGEGREREISIVHNPQTGRWQPDHDGATAEEREYEWDAIVRRWEALGNSAEAADLEPVLGPLVDRLLLAKGIGRVDRRSRSDLLHAFWQALGDAFAARKRNASGDYTPDPSAERFPKWEAPGDVSLTGLVEDWWKESEAAGLATSTYEGYRNTIRKLVAFLRHDDASRVTQDDVLRFKDHRLAERSPRTGKPVSAKTVRDNDLVGLKAIFGWAVANRRISSNPAKGVTIKLGRRPEVRSKGFTEEEARAVLRHAMQHPQRSLGRRGNREQPKMAAAKRWAPWLCAYSGARVGEILQLRKQDVRKEGRHWIITITPEAGTVKGKRARVVPVHPHLIEMGFADFVKAAPDGYLFLEPGRDGKMRGRWRAAKNRIAEFVREVVADRNVAPNHAWRHLFKTIGLEANIQERVLDELCGHVPRHVGGSYGRASLKTKVAAVKRFPRFKVDGRTGSN